jgi:hypothetical protein
MYIGENSPYLVTLNEITEEWHGLYYITQNPKVQLLWYLTEKRRSQSYDRELRRQRCENLQRHQ